MTTAHDGRNDAVEAHTQLARSIGRRYERPGMDRGDLEQEALLALTEAAERFDPDRGVPFRAFAAITIHGRLKHYIRDRAWSARVPRAVKERVLVLTAAQEEMERTRNRPATVGELAERLDASEEEVREAVVARQCLRTPDPLDRDAALVAKRDPEEIAIRRQLCVDVLTGLPQRLRHIVWEYYFEERTQAEIGKDLGVSQVRVSRLLTRAMTLMQQAVGAAA